MSLERNAAEATHLADMTGYQVTTTAAKGKGKRRRAVSSEDEDSPFGPGRKYARHHDKTSDNEETCESENTAEAHTSHDMTGI